MTPTPEWYAADEDDADRTPTQNRTESPENARNVSTPPASEAVLPLVAAQVEAAVSEARAETWADVCATLNDRADMWEADGSKRLAQESRDLANAYRTYAEGVGVPSMQTLREKRDEARTERDRVKRGAKELGRTLHRTLTDALDASGRHDVIDADGDGDWALVWETLAELRPRAEAAEAEVERLTDINRELVDTHNTYLKMVVRLEERAESAETDLRALREGLEALADEWVNGSGLALEWNVPIGETFANSLRALLAPSPAEGAGEAHAKHCNGRVMTDDGPECDCDATPAPVSSGEAGAEQRKAAMTAPGAMYCAEGYEVPSGRVINRQGAVHYKAACRLVQRLNAESGSEVRYRVRFWTDFSTIAPAPVVTPSAEGSDEP